jgi:hypothetical protein
MYGTSNVMISQFKEYSQGLKLHNLGSDLDPLWSYLLCTRHTKGLDKPTTCINVLLNNYGSQLIKKLPLHLLLENQ